MLNNMSAKFNKINVKKEPYIIHQDFDKSLLVTENNIIKYIQNRNPKIEFIDIENWDTKFAKNLNGIRNGNLVFKHPFRNNSIKDPSVYWIGMCDCGNFKVIRAGEINNYRSCGVCNTNSEIIYIGVKHNSLECIDQKYILSGKHSKTLMLKCKCDCGNELIMLPSDFLHHEGCGCNRYCKLSIENRHMIGLNNTVNITNTFNKGTNISKIGRKEPNKNSSTGYLGVFYNRKSGKYLAYITFQGKRENLGYYSNPEIAYRVRLEAQNMLHAKYLNNLNEIEFINNNKHLKKLLDKVKKKLQQNKNFIGDD